jgi:hypothetical protein
LFDGGTLLEGIALFGLLSVQKRGVISMLTQEG